MSDKPPQFLEHERDLFTRSKETKNKYRNFSILYHSDLRNWAIFPAIPDTIAAVGVIKELIPSLPHAHQHALIMDPRTYDAIFTVLTVDAQEIGTVVATLLKREYFEPVM
jgi:hypothetical protein